MNAQLLQIPAYRDLRDPFEPDADYERMWRARLLRNAKARAVDAKLSRWHERAAQAAGNVVELSMFHRRQAG